jgi:hypothetical protein
VTPEECLITYGAAWFERDPSKRIEVLRQCCTEDVVFMDPSRGRLEGLDEVSQMIGESMTGMSGSADGDSKDSVAEARGRTGGGVGVEVVTPIDIRHGFFRYSFVWTLPDGSRFGGTDFCEVAHDGRMKLITVWPADESFPLPTR